MRPKKKKKTTPDHHYRGGLYRDQMQTPSFNVHISWFYLLTSFPATPPRVPVAIKLKDVLVPFLLPELSQVSSTRLTPFNS